jgi:hypothetical protein
VLSDVTLTATVTEFAQPVTSRHRPTQMDRAFLLQLDLGILRLRRFGEDYFNVWV